MELHIVAMDYVLMAGETVALELPELGIKFIHYDGHHDHTAGEWVCFADSAACYPV